MAGRGLKKPRLFQIIRLSELDIKRDQVLGIGSQGMVYKALWKDEVDDEDEETEPIQVAAKKLTELDKALFQRQVNPKAK